MHKINIYLVMIVFLSGCYTRESIIRHRDEQVRQQVAALSRKYEHIDFNIVRKSLAEYDAPGQNAKKYLITSNDASPVIIVFRPINISALPGDLDYIGIETYFEDAVFYKKLLDEIDNILQTLPPAKFKKETSEKRAGDLAEELETAFRKIKMLDRNSIEQYIEARSRIKTHARKFQARTNAGNPVTLLVRPVDKTQIPADTGYREVITCETETDFFVHLKNELAALLRRTPGDAGNPERKENVTRRNTGRDWRSRGGSRWFEN